MQPHEFIKLWDGHRWMQEQHENIIAYFTACIMSVHTKRPVKPTDLLKPLRIQDKKYDKKTDEEYLVKIFNLKGGG